MAGGSLFGRAHTKYPAGSFLLLCMESHFPQSFPDFLGVIAGNQRGAAAAGQLQHLPVVKPCPGPGVDSSLFQAVKSFPCKIFAYTGAVQNVIRIPVLGFPQKGFWIISMQPVTPVIFVVDILKKHGAESIQNAFIP